MAHVLGGGSVDEKFFPAEQWRRFRCAEAFGWSGPDYDATSAKDTDWHLALADTREEVRAQKEREHGNLPHA